MQRLPTHTSAAAFSTPQHQQRPGGVGQFEQIRFEQTETSAGGCNAIELKHAARCYRLNGCDIVRDPAGRLVLIR